MPTSWSQLNVEAPDLADLVRRRFEANRHHVVGTTRRGGAPRLSGTEVAIDDSEVRIGMMPESRKLGDVLRDPRVEIHSAPLEDDLRAGDAKLAGRLISAGDLDDPPGSAFTLDIELVSLVQVDGDELVITTWRPGAGISTIRRS